MNRGLAVVDPDVHVQTEDQICTRHQLQVFHDVLVALVRMDFLGAPIRKRMRGNRSHPQAVFVGQANNIPAQLLHFLFGLFDGLADRCADLNHRLVHLSLDSLLQQFPAFFEKLHLDMRAQLARDRIYGLILFFNSDGEGRQHMRAARAPGARPGSRKSYPVRGLTEGTRRETL